MDNPRKIAKLITEDPDVFNEGWEEEGIEDPFESTGGYTPDELEKIANDPEAVAWLRSKLLSPEELEQIGFDKERRGRRDDRAFQHSMEAEVKTPMSCQEVQEAIKDDVNNPDLENLPEWWDHAEQCENCQKFKDQAEHELALNSMDYDEDDDDEYEKYLDESRRRP